jgi:CHAD domain-containing protein
VTTEALYTAPGLEPASLAPTIARLLGVHSRAVPACRVVCLDTFDGRIAARGGLLLQVGEGPAARLDWRPRDGRLRTQTALPATVAFAWNLPRGAVAAQLGPIIGVRRLLPVAELELKGRALEVLDDRGKPTARVSVASARARRPGRRRWHALPTLVAVTGVRARHGGFRRVRALVESRLGLRRSPEGLQALGLKAAGVVRPPDLSQVGLELSASERADAGARAVFRRLLAVIQANEAGVRHDLDTEFLHDYRVAIRRTRSLLGQLKKVFPPDRVEHFREEFRWLGMVTGPTRDLDVLMLALRQAPDDPAGTIGKLKRDVARRQRRMHRAMVGHLDGPRCRALFSQWSRFLGRTRPASPEPANASRMFTDLVSSRVRRLYEKLAERAALVTDQSPPAALHQIRIAAKKLRYVADLARSRQGGAAVDEVIAALKELQAVLGDYNDTVVHERLLMEAGRVLVRAPPERADILRSIGRLVKQLRARRASLRPRVFRQLRRFCSHRTRSKFRHLHKARSRAVPAAVGDPSRPRASPGRRTRR